MSHHQIKGLLHATSLENFERIIRTGAIICEMERVKLKLHRHVGFYDAACEDNDQIEDGQYPGVYMRAFTDFHHTRKIDFCIGEVIFVFCVELLKRDDYHINEDDDAGHISDTTFTQYCRSIDRATKCWYQSGSDDHEFVFHHFVPLRYVSEIWFQDISKLRGMEIPKHIRVLIKERYFYPIEVMSKPDIYVPKLQRHYIPHFDATDLGKLHKEQFPETLRESTIDRIKRMLNSYEFEDLNDDRSIIRDYEGRWQMIMLPNRI